MFYPKSDRKTTEHYWRHIGLIKIFPFLILNFYRDDLKTNFMLRWIRVCPLISDVKYSVHVVPKIKIHWMLEFLISCIVLTKFFIQDTIIFSSFLLSFDILPIYVLFRFALGVDKKKLLYWRCRLGIFVINVRCKVSELVVKIDLIDAWHS